MARYNRHQAQHQPSPLHATRRKATVVHDGSAFELAADLRRFGFDVAEGPLLSFSAGRPEPGHLAIIATRAGSAKRERMQEWTRELCWRGATLLAVGSSIGPVAEFFGASVPVSTGAQPVGRLASVTAVGAGLFTGLPREFRLALPPAEPVRCEGLNAEFGMTAWTKNGELVGASHVFRPVHLLHAGALESNELRPAILSNLLRLLRHNSGRAF